MKRYLYLAILSTLILSLAGCGGSAGAVSPTSPNPQAESSLIGETNQDSAAGGDQTVLISIASASTVDYDQDDLNALPDGSDLTSILLEGEGITLQGSGADVRGSTVTITAGGTYQISGSLDDGQVVVDSSDEETVHLILSGAEIHSSSSAPIYVLNAEKTVITLAEGSENTLTDGDSYQLLEDDEPNAALFSKDDLTINGSGSLTIYANYNHGIVSKDDLKIVSGTITIQAVNDGIKGRDSIAMLDPILNINAGGDGLQSNNEEDPEKGFVQIEGGTIQVNAELDGFQAETSLFISGGDFVITSGGGSANAPVQRGGRDRSTDFGSASADSGESSKGLKAGALVTITGGTFNVDSADDAVHSNGAVLISGGTWHLSTGDDGVHADSLLKISGGDLVLDRSYEGIESAEMLISGGTLHLTASDDGINGSTGSGQGGMPGMGGFGGGDSSLTISGGYIYVDAGGDGVDVNGSVSMSDGTLIVNGPTNSGNGPLDYLGEFNVSGGILVAVGSAGMAQAPSQSSSQYSLLYVFENYLSAGTAFQLLDAAGEPVLTFVPAKEYQAVVISTPDLVGGDTYQLSVGGTYSGSLADGFSTDGSYNGGSLAATITLTGMVTTSGAAGGFIMGAPGGGGGGRPHGRGK